MATSRPTGDRLFEGRRGWRAAVAGHSSGAPVIDLTAEDELLTAVDPTEPPPPGKLN